MTTTSITQPSIIFKYDTIIEDEITQLSQAIENVPNLKANYWARWLAIQLLEGDNLLLLEVQAALGGQAVLQVLENSRTHLENHYGEESEIILAEHRYGFVNEVVGKVLIRPNGLLITNSDRIDKIVIHRWLGIPIFLVMMWVVFKVTTDVAAPFLNWVSAVINGPITHWVVALLNLVNLGGTWLENLAVDGIIAGVGGVLVFVPVLISLYLALALLEDSGYMARAAFVMDRLMNVLGLHGRSFLPMVIGFGCNVPAIYATRTLENPRDRLLTGLLVPFMSCGARLPVYILFASIFFPQNTGPVIFGLYLMGIVTAIGLGVLLKSTLFKEDEPMPLLMELTPYRWPNLKTIWFSVWGRTLAFIKNAWTIILATSIIIWFLMAIPIGGSGRFAHTNINDSAFGIIAGAIAPVFTPLGFGNQQTGGALITGLVAKEVVISTLAEVYNVTHGVKANKMPQPTSFIADIGEIITSFFTATIDTVKSVPLIVGINLFETEPSQNSPELMAAVKTSFEETSGGHGALAGLAFMVFVLLYTPCIVTIIAEWHEFGAKWTLFSVTGQIAVAWLMGTIVFQGGKLLGLG